MKASFARHVLVLGALSTLGPLAIDMYLPSFPEIANAMHTDEAVIQLSLSSFFIGLAVGQLFYGPISDRLGRRGPMLTGLFLFILASFGCAMMHDPYWLIGLRFVQGVAGCVGIVITRAVIRDTYRGHQAARVLSTTLLVLSVSPVVAPMFGTILVSFFDWPAVFWALALFSLFCILLVITQLPESCPPEMRQRGGLGSVFITYLRLLGDLRFMATVGAGGFAQGGLFAYLAGSPFVFLTYHGLESWQFSALFASNAIGLIGAAQFSPNFIRRYGAEPVIRAGALVFSLAAMSLLVTALMGHETLPQLIATLFICLTAMGFVMPGASMLALEPHGANAGAAAALMGALQFTIGSLTGALVSAFFNGTPVPLIAVIAGCGLISLGLSQGLMRNRLQLA
ncbi:multidrug effflux MFS transporter [Radicibacter daui]|uniref:multidrug effflux MFS transporter n=1 Tax=Radicibacter daui TaxID=3064829 RepID=UPI004046FB73